MNRSLSRFSFILAAILVALAPAISSVNDILVHQTGRDACLASSEDATAYFLACTNTSVPDNEIIIYKSTDQGATWQAWTTLQRAGVVVSEPRIKLSGTKLYFVFGSASWLYFGTISLGNPANRREFQLQQNCLAPDLAVCQDKAYLVWAGYEAFSTFRNDIYFAKFNFTTESYEILAKSIGGQNFYDPNSYARPTIDVDAAHAPVGMKVIVAFEDETVGEVHVTRSIDGGSTFTPHQNITNTNTALEFNPKARFRNYTDDYAVVIFDRTPGRNGEPVSVDYLVSTDLFASIAAFQAGGKAEFPDASGGDFDFQYVGESYSAANRFVNFRGAHWENGLIRLFELQLRHDLRYWNPVEISTVITLGGTYSSPGQAVPEERISYHEQADANRCVAWNDIRNASDDVYFNGTTTVQKTITVTAPTAADTWTKGQVETTTWTTTGTITSVNILLFKGTSKVQDIALGTANDGTHAWTVPSNLVNGSDYRVKIEDASTGTITDFSDYFRIEAKSVTVTLPASATVWTKGQYGTINWTSVGTISSVNIYLYKSGAKVKDIAVGTANDGDQAWIVPADLLDGADYTVRVAVAALPGIYDNSDTFSIQSATLETISTPTPPTGAADVPAWVSSSYSSGGAASNLGHTVQYLFDWGDGSNSGWLPSGTTSVIKGWKHPGVYNIRAKARCSIHTSVESNWSVLLSVSVGTSSGYYLVLPEVIWAPATGGGTWVTEMQVTDVSGGTQVAVCFNYGDGQYRGPFNLWTSPGVNWSSKSGNILNALHALDPGFDYYGKVGALEFETQDNSHRIQVGARTLNGNYSKTFPGLIPAAENTAVVSGPMMIQGFTSSALYRSTCGFFNPTSSPLTVEFRLVDGSGATIGSAFTKTFVGYDFKAFSPFTEAGRPYPTYTYDNAYLVVTATSGSGSLVCFGASANNTSNDPAAHIAVQYQGTYANSPAEYIILPECIWAPATGGGTWVSEVQVTDLTGGSAVSAYFSYGGGLRQGPIAVWTNSGGAGRSVKFSNFLSYLASIDTVFTYYGKVGAVEFLTQDAAHKIHVAARTLNGNCSKTFPGLRLVDSNTADTTREMIILNYTNNSLYRSTCGFFNPTADPVTVEFRLYAAAGTTIGSAFTKTFVGYDFKAFSPFLEAGIPYPVASHDNVILVVTPTSGTGKIVCFGASANNSSNDPAAHIALQYH
jgi:hypothetical protein